MTTRIKVQDLSGYPLPRNGGPTVLLRNSYKVPGFLEVLGGSGYFSEVSSSTENPDYIISLSHETRTRGEASGARMAAYIFTLGVAPLGGVTEHSTIAASVMEGSSEETVLSVRQEHEFDVYFSTLPHVYLMGKRLPMGEQEPRLPFYDHISTLLASEVILKLGKRGAFKRGSQ